MSITVDDGALIPKDADDESVYVFDWDERFLAAAVTITTSTFTITALRPTTDTALTKDNPSILTGNRKTQIRVIGGTQGALYRLDNKIVTNESPPQTKDRHVFIKIE